MLYEIASILTKELRDNTGESLTRGRSMKQYIVEITEYRDASGQGKVIHYLGENEDHAWPIATNRNNAKVFTNLHDMASAIYDYARSATAYGFGASYFHYRPSADRILVLELMPLDPQYRESNE